MIISCESCSTRFKVPDDRVTAKGTKVRCSKCSHVFVVFPEGTSTGAASSPAPAPEKKKKTLQFRAGQLDEAVAQDERLQRRVTETFDAPPTKDPFSSENLPQTAADPFSGSGPAAAAPKNSTQQFLTPQNDPFSHAAPTKPAAPAGGLGGNDPFGGHDPFAAVTQKKPPTNPSPTPGAASSDPFGGAPDPFAPASTPPAAAPASSPPTPAPSTDPFSSSPPPKVSDPFGAAPDPFAQASAAASPGPSGAPVGPAADPFGRPPIPSLDASAAASAGPPASDPFGNPPAEPAGQFGGPNEEIGGAAADPFGPPVQPGPDDPFGASTTPQSEDPFGPPVQPGPGDPFGGGPAANDPINRPPGMMETQSSPPQMSDDPFGQSGGALDGLFDDADPGPSQAGPPPVPEGAKPITDPFSDEDLGPDLDDIGGLDDGDDEPARQNFQAETRVYSVPNELREASVPQAEAAPPPQNTSSVPMPPSIWRQRVRLVASTAWQIVVLALFMFIALVWARGGTLDDVLSGNIVGVITEGNTATLSDESLRILDVAVQRRTVKAAPALVVVSGEIQNTTKEAIRGVAVKVEFVSGDDAAVIAGPFYGWAGDGLSPIAVEQAETLATLAELAGQPIATTIDPNETTTFAVLAPAIPLGAVAKVSASPRSVALPLPASLPVPIEIVPKPSPDDNAKKKPQKTPQ